MNRDLLVVDEDTSCSDWPIPRREMQPVGFSTQHSHAGLSQTPAVTTQDVAQLADEVARMRAQFSRVLSEIEQKLSSGKASRWLSRRKRVRHSATEQHRLPFLPAELFPITQAIENSKTVFSPQPDVEEGLACSQATWQRATKLLIDHASSILEKIQVAIRPPLISAGPDGSVDLYWSAEPYGLLVNVPADPKQPTTYFGDDASQPDSNRTSGNIDPTKPIDIGLLMWLAHTAEQ